MQWMWKSWQKVEELTICKCYKKCSFSIDVPTDQEETEAPEEADNSTSSVWKGLDDVFIEEFVSFDDNSATTQTLAEDWEEEMFWGVKGDAQEDIPNSDLEDDLEEDEGETPVMWKETQPSISCLSCSPYAMD